jgi:hypothetical protein
MRWIAAKKLGQFSRSPTFDRVVPDAFIWHRPVRRLKLTHYQLFRKAAVFVSPAASLFSSSFEPRRIFVIILFSMSWFRKRSPDPDPSKMNNTELLQAVDALGFDRETLELLIDPDLLYRVMQHYGYTSETASQRWEKKPRPGEVLLEIARREPDRAKLLRRFQHAQKEFAELSELLGRKEQQGFVPPGEKEFPEAEAGDVLCSFSPKGYSLVRIIAKTPVTLKAGQTYSFSGQRVTAFCDDFFLSIPVSMTDPVFASEQEARETVAAGNVTWKIIMVPMRPSGLRANIRVHVGKLPPDQLALDVYEDWKTRFEEGTVGSF